MGRESAITKKAIYGLNTGSVSPMFSCIETDSEFGNSIRSRATPLSDGDDGFNADMDLDGDGTIDVADFLIFVSHFGSSA